MKTFMATRNAMDRIRIFLIAAFVITVTPHLSADIILIGRFSDATAGASGHPYFFPPAQSQTGFLPANLSNGAAACFHGWTGSCCSQGSSTSNSSIFINDPTEGLRVVGNGTASASGCSAFAGAKIIFLSFSLTEVSYPFSLTGQLNGSNATAKLTSETGTIFERVGNTTLSESGTLAPGIYTLSFELYETQGDSNANFVFAVDGSMSTPTPLPETLATNLSTRLLVGTGADGGIGGFIITGTGPRYLLLRGIGPSLWNYGVQNTLGDPTLELHGPDGFITITNNNWRDTQGDAILGTGRAPGALGNNESAIVANLAPGAYTAILGGNAGGTGVGLVEIYDLAPNQDSRLANISTRANVGTGDDVVIAGFILARGVDDEKAIIVRGIGPSLNGTVDGALADPKLELRNSQGALIASDDNWMDDPTQAAIIEAAGLAPGDGLESAIATTLIPGEYTALLSGVNNGTGVGLVEVYDRGAPAR